MFHIFLLVVVANSEREDLAEIQTKIITINFVLIFFTHIKMCQSMFKLFFFVNDENTKCFTFLCWWLQIQEENISVAEIKLRSEQNIL